MSYRAKPELWTAAERFGQNTMDMANCLLELRDRIEQLEATAKLRQQDEDAERAMQPAPAGGLVERVVAAISQELSPKAEARAAIKAVAEWLGEDLAAEWLRDELERHG